MYKFLVPIITIICLTQVQNIQAQSFDPANKDLKMLETMAGGNQIYVDTSKIKNNNGVLSFEVAGYSAEQKNEGGYTSGNNSIDCKTGQYNRSASVSKNADGSKSKVQNGEETPSSVTMRNDGRGLYNTLKDLCTDYAGLSEEELEESSW